MDKLTTEQRNRHFLNELNGFKFTQYLKSVKKDKEFEFKVLEEHSMNHFGGYKVDIAVDITNMELQLTKLSLHSMIRDTLDILVETVDAKVLMHHIRDRKFLKGRKNKRKYV